MTHWLIIYNRPRGELLSCDEYADGQAALAERFRLERDAHPDIEIVVLGADSLEALKVTHGRYFYSAAELAQRGIAQIAAEMISDEPTPEDHAWADKALRA